MIEVQASAIPEVKLITPPRHADRRGFFSETYNQQGLEERGIVLKFVQDNHSLSVAKGVIRGIHYQMPPHAQGKLVRVVRGAVFDVAVDLRRSSLTFGQHVGVILSAEKWNQILVPTGFGHGFCTLESNTEVIYKVTDYYAPECDRGILWNDPELAIPWPIPGTRAVVSDKDRSLPRFSAAEVFS